MTPETILTLYPTTSIAQRCRGLAPTGLHSAGGASIKIVSRCRVRGPPRRAPHPLTHRRFVVWLNHQSLIADGSDRR